MKATTRPRRSSDSVETCARELMETTLLVVRIVRAEVRRRRPANLTVTQVRMLSFFERNPGAALLDVAEHLGLGAPTASKLAHTLVRRGFVMRRVAPADRRRKMFQVTPRGAAGLNKAYGATRRHLAALLTALPASERMQLTRAMIRLRPVVTPTVRHGRGAQRSSSEKVPNR
jgi:DNA-binding MarR family transcriptional regulator